MLSLAKFVKAASLAVVVGTSLLCSVLVLKAAAPRATASNSPAPNVPSGLKASTPARQIDDKINFLLLQNEAARAKLSSGSLVFQEVLGGDVPADASKGELHSRSGTVSFHNAFRLGTKKETAGIALSAGGPIIQHVESETHSVIGPFHSGIWIVGRPLAEQYDHQSPQSMRISTIERIGSLAGEDYLQLGFGAPNKPLRELINEDPARFSWKVEEKNEAGKDHIFNLEMYFKPPKGGEPYRIHDIELNADKGFLVTSLRFYREDGRIWSSINMQARDTTGKGEWAITQLEDKAFADPSNPAQSPLTHYRMLKFQFKDVNQPIDDSIFDIKSLDLPERLIVAHEDAAGRKDVYVVANSRPVPQ